LPHCRLAPTTCQYSAAAERHDRQLSFEKYIKISNRYTKKTHIVFLKDTLGDALFSASVPRENLAPCPTLAHAADKCFVRRPKQDETLKRNG
jgi:hypothetical protein